MRSQTVAPQHANSTPDHDQTTSPSAHHSQPTLTAQVLQMQKQYGNAATAKWLTAQRKAMTAPVIQRMRTGETTTGSPSDSKMDTTDDTSPASTEPLFDVTPFKDGTEVYTESFVFKGETRTRQAYITIPFKTVRGSNRSLLGGKNQETPEPISFANNKEEIDRYSGHAFHRSHILRSHWGAPNDSLLAVPMTKYMNSTGGPWKQHEDSLDRVFGKKDLTIDWDDKEISEPKLQKLVKLDPLAKASAGKDNFSNGFLRVQFSYPNADIKSDEDLFQIGKDPRIPHHFHIFMHTEGGQIFHEKNFSYDDLDNTQHIPSAAMSQLLLYAQAELQKQDEEQKSRWIHPKHKPDKYGYLQGIPESGVPTPNRAMDFLHFQLGQHHDEIETFDNSTTTSPYDPKEDEFMKKYMAVEPKEQDLLKQVMNIQFSQSGEILGGQRELVEMFIRSKHDGKFLSDLSPEAAKYHEYFKKGDHEYFTYMYSDPVQSEELSKTSVFNTPELDHNVSKTTLGGSNFFTNFLYVSTQQNHGIGKLNKPSWLTNPNKRRAELDPEIDPEVEMNGKWDEIKKKKARKEKEKAKKATSAEGKRKKVEKQRKLTPYPVMDAKKIEEYLNSLKKNL